MKNKNIPLALAAAALLLPAAAHADDWPNWRGPSHNGISTETSWLAQWPADGPKRLWKASIGTGFASMAVSHGHVYAVGNQHDTDTIFCFDSETGATLWKSSYHCPLGANMYEGGPSATPTIADGKLYAVSKVGAIFCLDSETGKLLWTKKVAADLGLSAPMWGFASSPLVLGNAVFLDAGSAGIALDATTGNVLWSSGTGPSGYSTPVPCSINGADAVAFLAMDSLIAVARDSGKELLRFPWKTQYYLNIADPIINGGEIFISADYDHGCALLRVAGANAIPRWQNQSLCTHIASSVLVGGSIYGFDGNAGGKAILKCLDYRTGAVKWTEESVTCGGLIAAGDNLIIMSGNGELLVVHATPEAFKPVSRAQVLGGKCWTTPVLANARIYCRNAKGDLVCLDVKPANK